MTDQLPNIIFLDMDGVVCTPRACIAVCDTGRGFSYLDPIACLLVRRLCEEFNAKLVISSAWRQEYDKDSMEAILNANCPKLGHYIWRSHNHWRTTGFDYETGVSETSDRGREVKRWLYEHEGQYGNFVVLDDMADMRPVQDNLVRCDPYDGMGFAQWKAAGSLLSKPLPEISA